MQQASSRQATSMSSKEATVLPSQLPLPPSDRNVAPTSSMTCYTISSVFSEASHERSDISRPTQRGCRCRLLSPKLQCNPNATRIDDTINENSQHTRTTTRTARHSINLSRLGQTILDNLPLAASHGTHLTHVSTALCAAEHRSCFSICVVVSDIAFDSSTAL